MAYSEDARKMVLAYCDNGHTAEEAHQELKVSISTIYRWRKKLRETGSLENKGTPKKTAQVA